MATSGDFLLATSGDFSMTTDSRSGSEPVEHHVELTAHAEIFSWDLGEPAEQISA